MVYEESIKCDDNKHHIKWKSEEEKCIFNIPIWDFGQGMNTRRASAPMVPALSKSDSSKESNLILISIKFCLS